MISFTLIPFVAARQVEERAYGVHKAEKTPQEKTSDGQVWAIQILVCLFFSHSFFLD
jgi:hypothetical protein